MKTFETKPPAFTEEQIKSILKTHFNKDGRIKPLVSERDQNAHIFSGDGEFVLKIANSAEDREFLEFQNAVLNHIAFIDPGLSIPVVLKGKDENAILKEIITIKNPQIPGQTHDVRLLSFLKGDIFSRAEKSLELYENLGRFMGRFSKAMQGFGHPKAHQPNFLWNLDNALFCKQYVNDI